MDKDLLIEIMNNARENIYSWSLYFFKIDRRNNNPFTAYKIRFKNNEYLPEYARILIDMVVKYQLDKITEIKDYTGENTKVSCDTPPSPPLPFIKAKCEILSLYSFLNQYLNRILHITSNA